jgi:hypothetical protein
MNNLIVNATSIPSSKWSEDFKRKLKLKSRSLGFDVGKGGPPLLDLDGDPWSLVMRTPNLIEESSLMGGRFLVVATGVFDARMGIAVASVRKLGAEVIYPIIQRVIAMEPYGALGDPFFGRGREHEILDFSLWPVE